jgi:hypothetical protein
MAYPMVPLLCISNLAGRYQDLNFFTTAERGEGWCFLMFLSKFILKTMLSTLFLLNLFMIYIYCYEIKSKQKILKKSRSLPMVFKILMKKFQ